jgi:ribose-phosphate pyrophosphokinase
MNEYMMFPLPNNLALANVLAKQLNIAMGSMEIRDFPDGESYVRIDSNVENKTVFLVCTLDHPNNKVPPLMFAAQTMKERGANKIVLIAPYLPYMRQDKQFRPGEAITSVLFAKYLCTWIDGLITIDPHLHRIKDLADIYSIKPLSVLHATNTIAGWISKHIDAPLIIGPDEESRQWVQEVAEITSAPFVILKKIRYGDEKVSLSIPDVMDNSKTPVLVDDIISTGTSMIATMQLLSSRGFKNPVCIGVHALFNETIYQHLLSHGAKEIITCNTIPNAYKQIDISDIIAQEVKRLINMPSHP